MRALKVFALAALVVVFGGAAARADGVMRPIDKAYPKDFLRHSRTLLDVAIHGQVAVTTVTQDFVNEWDRATDAVYSFPLPTGARATEFLFWSNDTLFKAPLRVKEQAPNPGTGEGGVDALLTNYLGPNALRVPIAGIMPGSRQRVVLKYISLCRFDAGRFHYTFPLATGAFTMSPLDELTVTFRIAAEDSIEGYTLAGIGGGQVARSDPWHMVVTASVAKTYLAQDVSFTYASQASAFAHELHASRTPSRGGHFVMMLKTGPIPDSSRTLPKNVVFLVDRSATVAGAPFQLACDAIRDCLDRLNEKDRFNVIAFNSGLASFRVNSVSATVAARDSAKAFLTALNATGYSSAQSCILNALKMFQADSVCQILIVFTEGTSITNPDAIASSNTTRAAIFPVAISQLPSTARLEIMAYQNYGFPTFLKPTDPVLAEVRWLFGQVSAPIVKGTVMEIGANAFDLYPRDLRTIYAGSPFFLTGRYHDATNTALSVGGQSLQGPLVYSASLHFPADSTDENFVESFWAKEKIDQMERRITVSGATDSMKQELIRVSLAYGIRCMYTAYVAEKTQPMTGVDDGAVAVATFTAEAASGGVRLQWSIQNGARVRSLRVLRADSREGAYVPVAGESAEGTVLTDTTAGAAYAWYRLEIITVDGRRILSDAVAASAGNVPGETQLLQNYPNPFNPSTTIRYRLESMSPVPVALIVYDVLGRSVRTLVAETKTAGEYFVEWNGMDDRGRPVASGTYLYRLTAGTQLTTRAMVLVR
jgi:Ca-activated chloride channel homolog